MLLHLITFQPVLNHLNSQALLTQVITYVFSIKGFLARGACVCGGHLQEYTLDSISSAAASAG
jgi:hypothetical protein